MSAEPDFDHDATMHALRVGRDGMIDVLRQVKPMGVVYHGACMVIAAIDGFAALIAGAAEPFAIGGSVGPGRAEELLARMREVGG